MSIDAIRDSYDQVPYTSLPFAQTHPDRLAVLARLFALAPPPVESSRVLELGCAAGGNLIPMAVAVPDAQFVGVELSEVQVSEGRATIGALGLGNVRLEAMSIADVDERFGTFDYIIAHGVYSWVPDEIQRSLLEICARRLSPNGIAYVSYNTLPGWRMRGAIRDLMRYHANQWTTPKDRVRQARAILDFLARSVPSDNSAYSALLKSELEVLSRQPDYYILHEQLEEINEPIYFHQFIERAAGNGLQYLAEADFSKMMASNFPAEVNETLLRIAPGIVRQEQFIDFLRNRTFRQTLLVHDDRAVDRKITADRVFDLWVAASLRPSTPNPDIHSDALEQFDAANGWWGRTTHSVTKAALRILADRWPEALAFADLLRDAQNLLRRKIEARGWPDEQAIVLGTDLLKFFAAGLIELHAMPSPFTMRPGERPHASPLARHQLGHGTLVTNLRHESVNMHPNLARFTQLLDGKRSRDEVERIVTDWAIVNASVTAGARVEPSRRVREDIAQALQQLAQFALLM